jgi:phthalate 4,5-dioxygenase oxygenase subunit
MLSPEANELLTRIGPGTAMGELHRRFWFPALLSSELPAADGPPVRVRLLGEDLVAFRDSAGRVGIVDAFCSHRRAPLFFGRNEDCGLRCSYHGWKFDVTGACTDVPTEPEAEAPAFRAQVAITAYPVWEGGGAVWVYMGPPDRKPEIPQFEWLRLPPARSYVTKRLQRTNWAQAVEGGIDSAHISFLHSHTDEQMNAEENATRDHEANGLGKAYARLTAGDRRPHFEVKETDYGMLVAARRNTADKYYWRITQFLMPFFQMIAPSYESTPEGVPYNGHMWVPIDDENTWTWSFGASPNADYTPGEREKYFSEAWWGLIDEHHVPLRNLDNDYGLDRDMQRHGNFSGILGLANQDTALQEGMGRIQDRSQEHLGTTDRGITMFRKLMLNAARQLREGHEPVVPQLADRYNVRSVAITLDRSVPFEAGAAALLNAGAMAHAGSNG